MPSRSSVVVAKPKRTVVFVWHSAEEGGLMGSRYMADHPVVPLDKVAAQLNIDMIGRNRCDQESEANTVYGKLGIKCWICKGETKPQKAAPQAETVSA